VGLAVVLDDDGMVDGHVRGPPLEVLVDRVAALGHHLGDETVGIAHGGLRLVDELPLHALPALGVAVARAGIELTDLELLATVTALGELGLGRSLVALLGEGAAVLGPEALLQPLGTALPCDHDACHDKRDHQDADDDPNH
jgi:hypothetical protein